MSFQENLRYYREKAGFKSAKEFSISLGIPYPTYKGYESQSREPKFDTLCKIADLLDVSTDELLGRENNILGNHEDERLKQIIKVVTSSINENNAPFSIETDFGTDIIQLKFLYNGVITIDNINIYKQDIIKSINAINSQIDNTRNLLLFEKLATLGLDNAQEQCKRLIPFQQEFIKNWNYGHVKKGDTGELVSKEQIEKDLSALKNRMEQLTARQETILEYRKALQDFMNHNK